MSVALDRWHEIVRTSDASLLDALLDDDAVFESPVVHTPQTGKAKTAAYLRAALALLGNGSFRYVGEWHAESSAVLEFVAELDGVIINGVDLIAWNAAGRITRFKVMIRPQKAMAAVAQRMAERLSAGR